MNSTPGLRYLESNEMEAFAMIGICALTQSAGIVAADPSQNLTRNDCAIVTEGYCLPKNYNKLQRPNSSEATNVQVKFTVEQITSVNDDDFTISLAIFLSLYWKEDRLTYIGNDSDIDRYLSYRSSIPLGLEWANQLWLPDVYVRKMRSIRKPQILQEFGS